MTDRIAEIRAEGERAIAAATDTAALEDVRIQYLGRKAELPNLLRNVASLPAEERSATGKAANEARKALEAAIEQRAEQLAAGELEQRLERDRVDITLPADPTPELGRLHLITQTRREIEDVFIGLGFNVAEGPEVETVYYNFDALNYESTHPSRLMSGHVLRRAGAGHLQSEHGAAARAHLADAGPRDGATAAAALHHRPGRHVPTRQRRHPHAAVPPDRRARGRHRHHARRSPGDAAGVRARDLRLGARGPPAAALLPVHRAERRGRRVVLQLQPGRDRRRRALRAVQGHGVDRDPRVRDGRPERVRVRARLRVRP